MKFLCEAKKGRTLTLGTLMVAACLVSLAGLYYGPAEAQTPSRPEPPPKAEPPDPPPVAPPLELSRPPAPIEPRRPSVPGVRETPAPQNMSIDQLVSHVQELRDKKAELDKQEKEALLMLREKLMEQKQKLEQLGFRLGQPELPPLPPVKAP